MGSRRTRVLVGMLAAVAAVAALVVFGLASAHAPAGRAQGAGAAA